MGKRSAKWAWPNVWAWLHGGELIGVAKGAWLYECVANRGRGYRKGSADWWRCYEGGVAPGKGVANGGGPRSGRGRTWEAGLHGGER